MGDKSRRLSITAAKNVTRVTNVGESPNQNLSTAVIRMKLVKGEIGFL